MDSIRRLLEAIQQNPNVDFATRARASFLFSRLGPRGGAFDFFRGLDL